MKDGKKWYESITMWVSIATTVAGILVTIADSIAETGGDAGPIMTVVGVINAVLRIVTEKKIVG